MAPNPFPVPQAELDRLHARLDDARLPDLPDGAGWSYAGHVASLQAPDLLVDDVRGFAADVVA